MRHSLIKICVCFVLVIACTQAEPAPSPTAVSTPEPPPSTQLSPAPLPAMVPPPAGTSPPTPAKPAPTQTAAPEPAPVPLETFTSERFQFSAAYPRNWSVDLVSPQRIEIGDPLGTAILTIDFRIFKDLVALDEHNSLVLDLLNELLMDFDLTSSETLGGGIESTYVYTHPLAQRPWKAKMSTYLRGRLGIIVTVHVTEGAFDRYQPLIDTLLASVSLPGPDFIPPRAAITEIFVATGVDEVDGDPIGAGSEFPSSVDLLFVISRFRNLPVNSVLNFAMARVNFDGEEIEILVEVSVPVQGSGSAWGRFENTNVFPSGFYRAEVSLDGETVSATSFTVDVARFEDRRLGISFSYPGSWELERPEPSAVQFLARGEYFVRVDAPMVGIITLDFVTDAISEEFGDLEEISRTFVDDEVPGYLFRHGTASEDTEAFVETLFKVKGTRIISVIATARAGQFPRYETDFNLIRDSLRIDLTSDTEPMGADMGREELQEAIAERVAAITGLPAATEFDVRFITQEQFREETKDEEIGQESMKELETLQGFCVILDLCAASDNLKESIEDTFVERVLGTYVYEDKMITMVLDDGTFDPVDWITFAHEYAHALQDSQYNLSDLEPENASDDHSIAITALVEGSANVAENLFFESLSDDLQQEIAFTIEGELEAEDEEEPESGPEVPRIISETFGWAHSEGLKFASYLYFQGGLGAIDRAFDDLPQSTEQILHPQKYLDGEIPILVELPDISLAVGQGWFEQEAGTLGELMTGIYLATFIDEDQALLAAEGWGGDRYSLLKDGQDRWMIVMLHAWDSAVDAEEYFQLYLEFIGVKSEGLWESEPDIEGNITWIGEDEAVHLGIHDQLTLTIVGPDLAAVEAARNAVPFQ